MDSSRALSLQIVAREAESEVAVLPAVHMQPNDTVNALFRRFTEKLEIEAKICELSSDVSTGTSKIEDLTEYLCSRQGVGRGN